MVISPGAVHPTAFVGPDVRLGDDVTVGPYSVIEGAVEIGSGTLVLPHTIIEGQTRIGCDCRIGPHAVLGTPPQHAGYSGDPTWLVVEDEVTIREFATLNRAFKPGIENATRVCNGAVLMTGAHVGHDATVGAHAVLANDVLLGGHVVVGERAFLGGGSVYHQFVRVGRLAMVQGNSTLNRDVMPFGGVIESRHKGYNAIGCRRAGLSSEATHALRVAFRAIHAGRSAMTVVNASAIPESALDVPEVRELVEFIRTTRRGIQPSAAGEAEG